MTAIKIPSINRLTQNPDFNLIHVFKKDADIFLYDNELQLSSLTAWTNMYNRFDVGIQPREYLSDLAYDVKQRVNILKEFTEKPVNSHE